MKAPGHAIPPVLELDVQNMQINDMIRFKDVPLPEGCQLKVFDDMQPVVSCVPTSGRGS